MVESVCKMTLAKCTCRERRTFSTNWASSRRMRTKTRMEGDFDWCDTDYCQYDLVVVVSSSLTCMYFRLTRRKIPVYHQA
ncbi:hypothetical protein TNIN_328921 [Trichonephila inaurata madagascariensis]|uniref:Uncharacterized protein n=1 Tax=Trichonephila inaurata madagascariensis TaxID=2747483 RepID=A0A8X6WUC9_9ARAC|nr:hypothetical protein TNIN_328921 [Trichonephila inaurata madagascariensis]